MANLFPSTCCCTEDAACDCTLNVKYVETIDLLKLISIIFGEYVYYALGGSSSGDGNGGAFYWDPNSIATADDINIVQATGINIGRWIRVGSITEAYAAIYVKDGSTPQSIPTGATYTKCTPFTTNGDYLNCTPDAANDKITITSPGIYFSNIDISFSTDVNNATYYGALFIDGVEQNDIHFARKISVGANVYNTSSSGFIKTSSVPVDLDFRLKHDDVGSVAITFLYANLNIHKIGGA